MRQIMQQKLESQNKMQGDLKKQFVAEESNYQNQQIIIKADNLHKTYLFGLQGVAALRGVSLQIHQGQFVIILGNSGGGKTSLLNILGTIDKQTKGNYELYSEKIKSTTKDQILSGLRLNYLGFVFQTFNLIGSLTAKQNVQLPMILKGELSSSEIEKRAEKLLDSVGMSHSFPGGQQQRVTIARALANKPKMLLLDEPTGDLDSKNSQIVMDILLKLNIEQNITLVMVTHDVNLKFFSHRVLKVLDGKIIGEQVIDKRIREQHVLQLDEKVKRIHEEMKESAESFRQRKDRKQSRSKSKVSFLKPDSVKTIENPSFISNGKKQQNQENQNQKAQQREVQHYGPIKWLRQKRIRQKFEKIVSEKVRQELTRENQRYSKIKEQNKQKVLQLMD